jgi:transposase
LTDEESSQIEPLLPKPARTGHRQTADLREVINAIRYLARSGCGWRMLPKDFPPGQTVYWWLLFRRIHNVAVMIDRERAGREIESIGRRSRQPVD